MIARVHFNITGFVQGVGYRYFAYRQAKLHGVLGYVRNLPDGSVECVVEGTKEQIEAFYHVLLDGPPGAQVEQIRVNWDEVSGEYSSFEIRF